MTITIFEFILLCVCAALLLIIYNIIALWGDIRELWRLQADQERAWLRHVYPDPEPEKDKHDAPA